MVDGRGRAGAAAGAVEDITGSGVVRRVGGEGVIGDGGVAPDGDVWLCVTEQVGINPRSPPFEEGALCLIGEPAFVVGVDAVFLTLGTCTCGGGNSADGADDLR